MWERLGSRFYSEQARAFYAKNASTLHAVGNLAAASHYHRVFAGITKRNPALVNALWRVYNDGRACEEAWPSMWPEKGGEKTMTRTNSCSRKDHQIIPNPRLSTINVLGSVPAMVRWYALTEDYIGILQIERDLAVCASKFPTLVCCPIGAQRIADNLIALFEFVLSDGEVSIKDEKHYRLVHDDDLIDKRTEW